MPPTTAATMAPNEIPEVCLVPVAAADDVGLGDEDGLCDEEGTASPGSRAV